MFQLADIRGKALVAVVLAAVIIGISAPRATYGADAAGGFVEAAGSLKSGDKLAEKNDYNLLETRLQLRYGSAVPKLDAVSGEFFVKAEALFDGYEERGFLSVRELYLSLTPFGALDTKLGRQIITWGTGDYVFINDLFPKDYNSFFSGRDDEYLKVPSDALRFWLWNDAVNVDLAVIPVFRPNRSLDEDRFSYFDWMRGFIAGETMNRHFVRPSKTVDHSETALRLSKNISGYEATLYFFRGFYKEPMGAVNPMEGVFYYPRLNAYGASLQGQFAGGVANIEAGYYDSIEDKNGDDPMVENSSGKLLIGYNRDLGGDLRAGVQYLIERMMDYGGYEMFIPPGAPKRDRMREVATLRITKLLMAQTLTLGAFAFYSPTDEDVYFRASAAYAATDRLKVTLGTNVFAGKLDHTEFGQAKGNDNVYLRVRYGF
ncbi:MAG: hypothetical protein OEV59_01845 [Deltaproteobacteria bacterium]|nr:hypothetical protein [Deltaproteobacteria bacterium]